MYTYFAFSNCVGLRGYEKVTVSNSARRESQAFQNLCIIIFLPREIGKIVRRQAVCTRIF